MSSIQEATTIYESARQEPYVLEGRTLLVNWSIDKQFNTPSRFIYFKNFNNGDLGQLRGFLGDLSGAVDSAYFGESGLRLLFRTGLMNVCSEGQKESEYLGAFWQDHLSRY